ncbi:MAG TPA: YdeI/OmpD-associated family protein [Lacunisphaera sp.]|nr:YdeI/OmpD-associated family protein [Lacunisphaera sp.]
MNSPKLPPAIPPDFEHALKRGRVREFFLECAYVHRAGYLSWILTSVLPETRAHRIQQAVARLQAQRAEVLATARSARLAEVHRPAVVMAAETDPENERRSA